MPARRQTSGRRISPGRVRLRPQNPFDLIRLLARSQSDPRKAAAELVQNSLDAGARRIEVTWFNEKGRRALRIWDDGEGVFPELEREEALRRIARTIGHSHKGNLTPAERREQMVLGKYGIGLIGFWCVGEVMEIRSRVGGDRAWVLRLREDRAQGEIYPSRARLLTGEETFTEIVVRGVHEGAVNKIRPPRLQAYLANELRGQLLARNAVVRIRDRVARGRARKEFLVEPRPYLGRPLEEWRELEVPGFENARLELYHVAPEEERQGVVSLSCGGTVVMDDIAVIDGEDTVREPWCSGHLEGVIDFPELYVAPGTRRGFAHDEPVAAFLEALCGLESGLLEWLDREKRRRAAQKQQNLARHIRRAFVSVARRLPHYDLLPVRGGPGRADGRGASPGAGGGGTSGKATSGEPLGGEPQAEEEPRPAPRDPPERDDGEKGQLFPPGPLAALELRPKPLRLPPLATRGLRARALDEDGRPAAGEVGFAWHLEGAGELLPDGARASYTAPDGEVASGECARVIAIAVQGAVKIEESVPVLLKDPPGMRATVGGIPEPTSVSAPGEPWRSRLRGAAWEYNAAHPDYLAVADVEARRLRYLIHLYAKELVLRNFGGPGDAEVLERLVEVLTHLEFPRGRSGAQPSKQR